MKIARAEADRDKEAARLEAQRRAEREVYRPDALAGRPLPEPVHFWEVAERAFAAEDAAEADRGREIQKRVEQETGL